MRFIIDLSSIEPTAPYTKRGNQSGQSIRYLTFLELHSAGDGSVKEGRVRFLYPNCRPQASTIFNPKSILIKFTLSALALVCPAFAHSPVLFPNVVHAVPTLGCSIPVTTLQILPALPDPQAGRQDTSALICMAAEKHGVPAAFVKSIMAAESNFNCDAISAKGAVGLMQLMPETAREYGADPSIPAQNVDAGTHYLRILMDKYHEHGDSLQRVIAAYNAGPAMVDRYHGVPPFRETRRYVARVLGFLRRFQKERT
jgi:hypothetical protein